MIYNSIYHCFLYNNVYLLIKRGAAGCVINNLFAISKGSTYVIKISAKELECVL